VDALFQWAAAVAGLTSVLTVLAHGITKIIILKMVLKDVPVEQRAEVLIAVSYLFSFRWGRGGGSELGHPTDKPPDGTGPKPGG
jgi:hypothetical protein